MRHELHTTIDIDAPPADVWAVLTDLDGYAGWNPFIVSAQGRVQVGERLENRLSPPGGKAMTFKPTVTVVEEAVCFEWLGRLVMPGVFDGRHRFELIANGDGGTTLVHSEQLSGFLVRPLRAKLDSQTKEGFVAMNEALKSTVESARCVTT